jgi:beta-lactam-binding protein with PASTA domain
MRAFHWLVAVVVFLGVAGCGGKDPVMPDVTGQKLDTAKSAIKDAGFSDKVKVDGGGVFGVIKESNWEVCKQSPAAGKPVTDTPRLKVDRSCNDGDSKQGESPSPEPSDNPEASDPSATPSAADENLTVQNNQDFAALLASKKLDFKTHKAFVAKYRDKTVEFDGCIALMMGHGDYKTRFDVLVYRGNYNGSHKNGPSFDFINVNYYDFNLKGPKVPDTVSAGQNYHVVATVAGWDGEAHAIQLAPVSMQLR